MQPDDIAFIKKETPSGKTYMEHSLLRKEAEAQGNREIASLLLDNGFNDIILLPQIYASRQDLRVIYYGSAYTEVHKTQCPDASVDGNLVEFKHTTARNMAKRLSEAAKQSDAAVLRVDEPLTRDYMERFAKGRFEKEELANVKQIIIVNENKVYVFDRKAKAK
jgi:hypothetical protein